MANQQMLPAGSFYRALFEQEAVGVAQIDTATGRFVRVNQRCCDIVGYAPQQMGALAFQTISVPDDLQVYLNNMARLAAGKIRAFTMEKRCLRQDGKPVWVNLTVSALWPVGQPAHCHLVLVEDITERKRAEAALQENESLLRAIGNNLPNCMLYQIVRDNEGNRRFAYVSDAVRRFYGCSPAEAMADPGRIYGRVAETDRQRLLAEEEKAFAALATFATEAPVQTPSGGLRWSSFASSPRLLEDGSTCWDGIEIDITDRKKAEEALRESEERLRLALQAANQGFYDLNVQTGEAIVSDEYARMLDYDPARFKESNAAWLQRLHPDDVERVTAVFNDYIAGKIAEYRVAFRQRTASGQWKWILSCGRIMSRDDRGRPLRMLGTHTDITERKALEDQLAQAQKMESVGRLAGGVAHDFNNMLQTILGFTDLALAETPPQNPVHGHLLMIRKAAERSADLTRQLLAFARKQTVSPRLLDLNDTVAGMLKMLRRLIGEDIELVWKPGPNLGTVSMDPAQVDQVLANLAVNARDAITGVGNLTIETDNAFLDSFDCQGRADLVPGHYVVLSVSDNGCGMGKDVLDHLFEPFFTTKEVGKGTGLGLATVYGIVKQNNGLIEVHSQTGQGTTFKVFLPRVQSGFQAEPMAMAPKPVQGSETILLVEDDESILHLSAAILQKNGYTVLPARSPGQALALLQQHQGPLHLLITDVVMPEMNGKDLSKQVTTLKPAIKTLYMSGYTADVIAHHGVLENGVEFLQKPFSLRTLSERVREVLDH